MAITAVGREAAEHERAAQPARVSEVLRRFDPSRRMAVLEGMRALTDALREIEGEGATGAAAGPPEGGLPDA